MNDVADIEKLLLDATNESVANIDNQDFLIFKAAAQTFLTQIETLSMEHKLKISKSNIKNKIVELYDLMRQNTAYTRAILQYQHAFENALDTFLGRTIMLSYVVPDGNIRFYGSAKVGELYQVASKQWGRANITKGKVLKIEEDDLQEEIKNDIQNSIKNKNLVYQEALIRYNEKNKAEKYMHYDPSERTFYWWAVDHKKLGGWTDQIANRGPIAEGYAGAVINQDPEVSNNNIEHSLKMLWLNHIKKDSIGAAIKGDIVLDSNNNIQFAVKSGSFSTARIKQYIALADNIIKINSLTPEQLSSNAGLLYQLSGNGFSDMAEKIVNAINNNVVSDELDELLNSVKKS